MSVEGISILDACDDQQAGTSQEHAYVTLQMKKKKKRRRMFSVKKHPYNNKMILERIALAQHKTIEYPDGEEVKPEDLMIEPLQHVDSNANAEEPSVEIKPCQVVLDRIQVEQYLKSRGKKLEDILPLPVPSPVSRGKTKTSPLLEGVKTNLRSSKSPTKKSARSKKPMIKDSLLDETKQVPVKDEEPFKKDLDNNDKEQAIEEKPAEKEVLPEKGDLVHEVVLVKEEQTSGFLDESLEDFLDDPLDEDSADEDVDFTCIYCSVVLTNVNDVAEHVRCCNPDPTAENARPLIKTEPCEYEDSDFNANDEDSVPDYFTSSLSHISVCHDAEVQTDEMKRAPPTLFHCALCNLDFVASSRLAQHVLDWHLETMETTFRSLGCFPKQGIQMIKFVSGVSGYLECPYCFTLRIHLKDFVTHLKCEHKNDLSQSIVCKKVPVKIMKCVPLCDIAQQSYHCGYCDKRENSFKRLKTHLNLAHKIVECSKCICFFQRGVEIQEMCKRCSAPVSQRKNLTPPSYGIVPDKRSINSRLKEIKDSLNIKDCIKSNKVLIQEISYEPDIQYAVKQVFEVPESESDSIPKISAVYSGQEEVTAFQEDAHNMQFKLLGSRPPSVQNIAAPSLIAPRLATPTQTQANPVVGEKSPPVVICGVESFEGKQESTPSSADEDDYGVDVLESILQRKKAGKQRQETQQEPAADWELPSSSAAKVNPVKRKATHHLGPASKRRAVSRTEVELEDPSALDGNFFITIPPKEIFRVGSIMTKGLRLNLRRFRNMKQLKLMKTMPCLYCLGMSNDALEMSSHMLLEHSYCAVCREVTDSIENHSALHSNMLFYQCSFFGCNQTFQKAEQCITHEEFVHDCESSSVSEQVHPFHSPDSEKSFNCCYCAEYFDEHKMLDHHFVYEHNVCCCLECKNYHMNGQSCYICKLKKHNTID